jgi:hypothetical protein
MRVKIYITIALFICLLLPAYSVNAISTHSFGGDPGGISSTIPNNLDLKTPATPTAATPTDTSSNKPLEASNDFSFYQLTYSGDSATIYCLGSDGYYTAGIISFYPDGSTPVPTAYVAIDPLEVGRTYPQLYYPISKFNDVMSILRYTNSSLSVFVTPAESGIRVAPLQTGPHGGPRLTP